MGTRAVASSRAGSVVLVVRAARPPCSGMLEPGSQSFH
jgi:hypothetical protein